MLRDDWSEEKLCDAAEDAVVISHFKQFKVSKGVSFEWKGKKVVEKFVSTLTRVSVCAKCYYSDEDAEEEEEDGQVELMLVMVNIFSSTKQLWH